MAGDPVFFRIAPLPRSYSMTSGEALRVVTPNGQAKRLTGPLNASASTVNVA